MMRRLKDLAAAALLFAWIGGPAFAQTQEKSLTFLIAGLQRLQVKVAQGDAGAPAEVVRQLSAIDRAITAAPSEYWKNADAQSEAAIFIFGGGPPKSVAHLIEANLVPAEQQGLLRGALAYALGREKDAEALLGQIDPKTLDARLAGQFAYVAAVLAARQNPEKSIGLLDMARVLSPSTLVEEASLRREALFLASRGTPDRSATLAKAYFVRFGASPYAARFSVDLAAAVEGYAIIHAKDELEGFVAAARAMPVAMRKAFLLSIARGELLRGDFAMASEAAEFLLPDTARGSADESRRLLYAAPAHLLGADFDLGNEEFAKVSPDKLDHEDRMIYQALAYFRPRIRQPPAPYAERSGPPPHRWGPRARRRRSDDRQGDGGPGRSDLVPRLGGGQMSAAALVSANAGLRPSENLATRQRGAGDSQGFEDILSALPHQATPNAGGQGAAAPSPSHLSASTWSSLDGSAWALASPLRQSEGPTLPPASSAASQGHPAAGLRGAVPKGQSTLAPISQPQGAIATAPTSNHGAASPGSAQDSAWSANKREAAVSHAAARQAEAPASVATSQGLDPSAALLSAQSALSASAIAGVQAPIPTAQSASVQTGSAMRGAREAMGAHDRSSDRNAITDADRLGLTDVAVGMRSVAAKAFHAPTRPSSNGGEGRGQALASPGKIPAAAIPDGAATGAQRRLPTPDAASHSHDGQGSSDDTGAEPATQNGVAAIDVGVADAPVTTYSAVEVPNLLADAATDLGAQAPPTPANVPQATTNAVTKRLEIMMDPEGLGSLTATLTLSGGAISIVVEATTAEGEAAMNAQLGALTARLSTGAQPIASIRIIRANPESQPTETSDATDVEPSPSSGARTAGSARPFPSGRGVGGDMVV